jgi:hypothetical protein|tara:strand:+ start:1147 stop:1527 length:381 start_codon:yes stop_codon:yes gene_type:complete
MKSGNNNKSFGLLFFTVFLLIGLWPLTTGGSPRIVFFIFAGFFLILGLINSKILTPLNKLWIKFGELLGRIIAPIVMAVVYFVVLTPLSFLIRISGKDLLKLKYSNKVNSYWIKREKDLGPMDKQF